MRRSTLLRMRIVEAIMNNTTVQAKCHTCRRTFKLTYDQATMWVRREPTKRVCPKCERK